MPLPHRFSVDSGRQSNVLLRRRGGGKLKELFLVNDLMIPRPAERVPARTTVPHSPPWLGRCIQPTATSPTSPHQRQHSKVTSPTSPHQRQHSKATSPTSPHQRQRNAATSPTSPHCWRQSSPARSSSAPHRAARKHLASRSNSSQRSRSTRDGAGPNVNTSDASAAAAEASPPTPSLKKRHPSLARHGGRASILLALPTDVLPHLIREGIIVQLSATCRKTRLWSRDAVLSEQTWRSLALLQWGAVPEQLYSTWRAFYLRRAKKDDGTLRVLWSAVLHADRELNVSIRSECCLSNHVVDYPSLFRQAIQHSNFAARLSMGGCSDGIFCFTVVPRQNDECHSVKCHVKFRGDIAFACMVQVALTSRLAQDVLAMTERKYHQYEVDLRFAPKPEQAVGRQKGATIEFCDMLEMIMDDCNKLAWTTGDKYGGKFQ